MIALWVCAWREAKIGLLLEKMKWLNLVPEATNLIFVTANM